MSTHEKPHTGDTSKMEAALDLDSLAFRHLVSRLIDVLGLLCRHHRSLVEILGQKKAAMVRLEHDDLEMILDLEREIVGSIGSVEEERIEVTRDIARSLGMPGDRIRLRELVMHVGDEFQEDLIDLRDDLRDIADEIEKLNQHNRTLAVYSLEHVNFHIALLAGRDPEVKTYAGRGALPGEGLPSLLVDRKV